MLSIFLHFAGDSTIISDFLVTILDIFIKLVSLSCQNIFISVFTYFIAIILFITHLNTQRYIIYTIMSRFLKLSKCIINTQLIRYVLIEPAKYEFKLMSGTLSGAWMLGSGSISTDSSYVIVSEKESPEDFKQVTEWIKEQ